MVPLDSQQGSMYAVTARHCVEEVKDRACDAKLLLRVNVKSGGFEYIETHVADWTFHPTDEKVDVAVHPISTRTFFQQELDHLCIRYEMLATEAQLEDEWIGIGGEVFATGLFKHHTGSQRNIPIVRVGNIAAMPEEKVTTRKFGDINAFLIECRSIGGVSGSPVFAKIDEWTQMMRNGMEGGFIQIRTPQSERGHRFLLIGLVHGHWDDPNFASQDSQGSNRLNTGIAIIVPTDDILAVIKAPNFERERDVDRQINMLCYTELLLPPTPSETIESTVLTSFASELTWSNNVSTYWGDSATERLGLYGNTQISEAGQT